MSKVPAVLNTRSPDAVLVRLLTVVIWLPASRLIPVDALVSSVEAMIAPVCVIAPPEVRLTSPVPALIGLPRVMSLPLAD